jgi:hypothetical protein
MGQPEGSELHQLPSSLPIMQWGGMEVRHGVALSSMHQLELPSRLVVQMDETTSVPAFPTSTTRDIDALARGGSFGSMLQAYAKLALC